MHELSIAMEIIGIVEENATREGATEVTGVDLEIGVLSGVVPEALEFALESAVKDTLMEKAVITMKTIEGRAFCEHCKTEFGITDLFEPCPACNLYEHKIIRGRELKVLSVRITEYE